MELAKRTKVRIRGPVRTTGANNPPFISAIFVPPPPRATSAERLHGEPHRR